MRHLLCHQSGIPHYNNGRIISIKRSYEVDNPFLDPVLAIDKFANSPLIFQPGERVDYSSYAYVLLSAVVQRAGKQDLQEQLMDRIAKRLKMTSFDFDLHSRVNSNWSVGYIKDQTGIVTVAPEEENFWKHGAGAYKSNIQDFARFAEALTNNRLLSKRTKKIMWTTQPTTNGQATTWGLGFTIDNQHGLKVMHNGEQAESSTRIVLYPEKKHGVVVMSNCRYVDPSAIATAVYRGLKE